jgi:hypothetical protein
MEEFARANDLDPDTLKRDIHASRERERRRQSSKPVEPDEPDA